MVKNNSIEQNKKKRRRRKEELLKKMIMLALEFSSWSRRKRISKRKSSNKRSR